MKVGVALLAILASCSSPQKPPATVPSALAPRSSPATPLIAAAAETMAADTPKTTTAGNTFVVPAGWKLSVRDDGTIIEAPESGSFVAFYDLPQAKDQDDAIAQAWTEFRGKQPAYAASQKIDSPDSDGWSKIRGYNYDVPPNARRFFGAGVMWANNVWTVMILDLDSAVVEKRQSQLDLLVGLLPRGGKRPTQESFAGKKPNVLDKDRITKLVTFIENAEKVTGVPGVSFGLIQDGKVIYAGGVGVRELGKPAKVDANTKYLIASNTKPLVTLMLAKLVDANKLAWDTPAKQLWPAFKLGDADTTSKVLVKHLVCACTGLPRQDLDWLLEYSAYTPEKVLASLGAIQPTSKLGELFQYSNAMAAGGGFLGGHVVYPKLELGAAFDKTMQDLVFGPLRMSSTTFDFKKGSAGNAAVGHAPGFDGKPALALATPNYAMVPFRPAGGAWSNVTDLLKYVQMELAEGTVGGKRYIGKDALLARRAPQVAISSDGTYGMGLMVERIRGVEVVHHGGDLYGYHGDVMWMPELGVGAVVLTNGNPGELIRATFIPALLDVLFDGEPKADAALAAGAKSYFDGLEKLREQFRVPADASLAGALASRYKNDALGEIAVKHRGAATLFDVGEYASEVSSHPNPDGTVSFLLIAPGLHSITFVTGARDGKRTLVLRDSQHEYVFVETP